MDLRATIGRVLAMLGVVCAVVGIFVLEGISIEFPGIILGGLGYYFGLTSQDRASQILGIVAAVFNIISMVISGLAAPPQ
jgi:hypothetical protein